MLLNVVLACLSLSPSSPQPIEPAASLQASQDRKAEFAQKRKSAEGDVAKLWELFNWCDAYGLEAEGRSVLRAIVKLEPDNTKAHELLGEILHDGKWFANEKAIEEYKAKALAEEAKRTGKVVFKGTLVSKEDLPYLQRGLVRDDAGNWVDAAEAQKLAEGWVRQDLEWIAPDERENIEKGLWKCGDKWLAEAEADTYHAEVTQCWRIPRARFVLYATVPRKVAELAVQEMERAFDVCTSLLGPAPQERAVVLLLRSQDQYNRFARNEGRTPVELRGLSSCYGAFLAEVWPEPHLQGKPSAGVSFWDFTNEVGHRFGRLYSRHAAALSFVELVDGSPKALEQLKDITNMREAEAAALEQAFWSEKQLPPWYREGVVSYAERYMPDSVQPPGGDVHWLRKWSVSNIGTLDALDTIFAFQVGPDDCRQTARLMNQAGLLVAFAVDGKVAEVNAKQQAIKQALQTGNTKGLQQALKELQAAIKKNEAALRTFAGL